MLERGALAATVFHNPAALAVETLRAAAALARGELDVATLRRRAPVLNPPARPVAVLDVPYQVITRENVAELAAFWRGAGAV